MQNKKKQIFTCLVAIANQSNELCNENTFASLDPHTNDEVKKIDVFEAQLKLIKIKAEIEVLDKCLDFEIERLNALGL